MYKHSNISYKLQHLHQNIQPYIDNYSEQKYENLMQNMLNNYLNHSIFDKLSKWNDKANISKMKNLSNSHLHKYMKNLRE